MSIYSYFNMSNRCRPLLLAVIVLATAGAASAGAQTLMLMHAPAGTSVDVTLNGAQIGSGTTDADGQAKVPLASAGKIGVNGRDANIYLDVCGKAYHVVIIDNGKTPAPAEDTCDRRDISGIFWVRPINTIVIDVAETPPSLLLIKGAYKPPPAPTPEGEPARRPKTPSPSGLMVFAGGGISSFSDLQATACGDTGCSGKNWDPAYSFGAEYWFKSWFAAKGSFIKPAQAKVHGSTDAFNFNTGLDSRIYTIEGQVGPAYPRFKIYGHGGMNFQQSTMTTTETIQPTTVTQADGTVLPVPGGTQTFTNKTSGWSWMFGAAGEFWMVKKVALYGEMGIVRLQGSATDNSHAILDDHNTYVMLGVKLRLKQ